MNFFGICMGLIALVVIGVGFVWVIRTEKYLGYLWWPYFMGGGIVLMLMAGFIQNDWGAAILGVVGASMVWGATEFKHQAIRAELGWFPFRQKKLKPPFAAAIEKWKAPHL